MKKSILTFLGILLISAVTLAQSEPPTKGVKVYLNAFTERYSLINFRDNQIFRFESDFTRIGSTSAGYAWKKDKWCHEFEASYSYYRDDRVTFAIPDSGGIVQLTEGDRNTLNMISTRYEKYQNIISKEKFAFQLGGSGQAFWLNNRLKPLTSQYFPRSYNQFAINLPSILLLFLVFRFTSSTLLLILICH